VLVVVVLLLAARVASLGGRVGTLEQSLGECRVRAVDLKRDHDALAEVLEAEREAARARAEAEASARGDEGEGGTARPWEVPLTAVHLGGGKPEPVVRSGKEAGKQELNVLAARFRAAGLTLGELQEAVGTGASAAAAAAAAEGDPGLELEEALGLVGGGSGKVRRDGGKQAAEVHRELDPAEIEAFDAARSKARDAFFAEAEAWLDAEAAKVREKDTGKGRSASRARARSGEKGEGAPSKPASLKLDWGDRWGAPRTGLGSAKAEALDADASPLGGEAPGDREATPEGGGADTADAAGE